MRLVTYGAACSLDGFIARTDCGVDWLRFTPDAQAVMRDYWSRIDTVLMGRKTWEVAACSGASGGGYPGVASFVFSRTLEQLPHRGAELVREDAAGFVRALKQKPGKDICVMGGGDFARSLLEAGVVDEIGINVHPVVLGSGVPLFLDPRRQVDLELTECRQMAEGCVLLRYRIASAVAKPRAAAATRRAKR